jgi:hypothetical protein
MAFKALFDESGVTGTNRFMCMAGIFGQADELERLTAEWEKHLAARHPGRIGYFKLDEALGLDGEFKFWQPANRDLKVRQMADLLDQARVREIAAVMDLTAYHQAFSRWASMLDADSGKHHSMRDPYMLLATFALEAAFAEAIRRNADGVVEVVFDNHDLFRQPVLDAYVGLLDDELDLRYKALMPAWPSFRDDRECVLVQAADFLAGELRILAESNLEERAVPRCLDGLFPNLKTSGCFELIAADRLRDMHEYARRTVHLRSRE